ncbi:recombinase family protein [Bradyrhizobium sp. LLZ17]|uniref:Recombinase family protein n=1 Tax=Bradyrhizobium sp. LLZ17 TaxID=3239388 RepID=A0AB39XVL6_9BRAD
MSTDLQLKGDSLRRQREASRKYAERHGLELVDDDRWHDIGVSAYSGKNIASGRFGEFLEAVRAGEVEKGSYLLVEIIRPDEPSGADGSPEAFHGDRRGRPDSGHAGR